jgi:hypothetical protein
MACGLFLHKAGGFPDRYSRIPKLNDLVQVRLLRTSHAQSGTLPPTFGHSARLHPTSVTLAYPTLGRMCEHLSDEPFLFRDAELRVLAIQQEQV